MPKTKKLFRYNVRGSGSFPVDMLRYDNAHFADPTCDDYLFRDEDDSESNRARFSILKGPRTVAIEGERCTEARWRSFGWNVTKN